MTHTTHCLYFSSFYDKYSITFKTLDHSCYQALSTKVINLKVYSLKISFGKYNIISKYWTTPLMRHCPPNLLIQKSLFMDFFPMAISMQGWLFFRRSHLHAKMAFFPRGHLHACMVFDTVAMPTQAVIFSVFLF